MTAQSASLLNLDTLVTRPAIEVDGVRYELLSPDELSVLESQRFFKWAQRLDVLREAGEESEEADAIVAMIASAAVVAMPEDVFGRLSGIQKLRVAEVFTALLLSSQMSTAGAVAKAMGNLSTGDERYRASSASTEAVRASGWKALLSRWFGLA